MKNRAERRQRIPHKEGGVQVRVCGFDMGENLICTLPPRHQPRSIHATTAISDAGGIVAALYDLLKGKVEMWQLVGPPE